VAAEIAKRILIARDHSKGLTRAQSTSHSPHSFSRKEETRAIFRKIYTHISSGGGGGSGLNRGAAIDEHYALRRAAYLLFPLLFFESAHVHANGAISPLLFVLFRRGE
jgi:hypothetical protein